MKTQKNSLFLLIFTLLPAIHPSLMGVGGKQEDDNTSPFFYNLQSPQIPLPQLIQPQRLTADELAILANIQANLQATIQEQPAQALAQEQAQNQALETPLTIQQQPQEPHNFTGFTAEERRKRRKQKSSVDESTSSSSTSSSSSSNHRSKRPRTRHCALKITSSNQVTTQSGRTPLGAFDPDMFPPELLLDQVLSRLTPVERLAFRGASPALFELLNAHIPVILTLTVDEITANNFARRSNLYQNVTQLTVTVHPTSQNKLNPAQIKLLAKYFPHLTHLFIPNVRITDTALKLLFQSFPGLTHLDLSGNALDARNLTTAPAFNTTLISLDISRTNLTQNAFTILTTLGVFPNLRELDISGNPITPATIRSLAQSSFAGSLQELYMALSEPAFCLRDSEIIDELTAQGAFPALQHLDLYNHVNDNQTMRLLSQSAFAQTLSYLNIAGTGSGGIATTSALSAFGIRLLGNGCPQLRQLAVENLDEPAILALSQASFAGTLQALQLTGFLTEVGAQRIAQSFTRLRRLGIAGTFSLAALRALAVPAFAHHIETLSLINPPGSHAHLRSSELYQIISESNSFINLTELVVTNQHTTDNDILTLASAPFAPSLRVLDVTGNHLSAQGAHYLAHPETIQAQPSTSSTSTSTASNSSENNRASRIIAFSNLEELYLAHSMRFNDAYGHVQVFGNAGISNLTNNPVFANTLRILDIRLTYISAIGIHHLAQANLPCLRALYLQEANTLLSETDLEWLTTLGQASFAHELRTLGVAHQAFALLRDRNTALMQNFPSLATLNSFLADYVMRRDSRS